MVRVAVVDEANCVLLMRILDSERRLAWALPGGGVEGRETDEAAAQRELLEEFGVADVSIGPMIASRVHLFPMREGGDALWRERHYLARSSGARLERAGSRWWSVDDLRRSRARFSPPRLKSLLVEVLSAGCPVTPVDLSVD